MSKQRTVRDYLACEYHGETRAKQVCGECGTPLCEGCSEKVTDATLDDYDRDGLGTLVVGALLVVGAQIGIDAVPRGFWRGLAGLAGKPLYIQSGLKTGLVLVGVATLLTVRFRRRSDGFGIDGLQLLTRESNERIVCEACYDSKNLQRWLSRGIGLVVVALVLYGLYQSFSGVFFRPLRIVGAGVALWILRDDLVVAIVSVIRSDEL